MNYKNYLLIAFLIWSFIALAQDEKYPSFINADSNWGVEIIPFPLEWGPKMTLVGYEELRFTPNWSDPKSADFWSLIMGWNVTSQNLLDVTTIAHNLKHYFDGLMKPNQWAEEFPNPIVTLNVLTQKEVTISYKGSLEVFDGFHTGKRITLNIQATQQFDKEGERTFVLIRFSPKSFEHRIWDTLKEATIKDIK